MRASYTDRLLRSYSAAPQQIQRAFKKQIDLLLVDLRHPSLHAKKYDESRDIWQARVTKGWRFYFLIEGDVYHILEIKSHPK